MPTLWSEYTIPDAEPLHWAVGPLNLWCKRVDGELHLASKRVEPPEEGEPAAEPIDLESLDWIRCVTASGVPRIRLAPAFPDRPVVVTPESTFKLMPGAEARIYVRCPVWVKLQTDTEAVLADMPSIVLSNTWFGTFQEGELCYWHSTSARREALLDANNPHLVQCPVQVMNESKEELLVEKFCLRVRGLSLYYHDGQLWADETRVVVERDQETKIHMSGKPPREAPRAELIAKPRIEAYKSLVGRTFASLRELPGLGFGSR